MLMHCNKLKHSQSNKHYNNKTVPWKKVHNTHDQSGATHHVR